MNAKTVCIVAVLTLTAPLAHADEHLPLEKAIVAPEIAKRFLESLTQRLADLDTAIAAADDTLKNRAAKTADKREAREQLAKLVDERKRLLSGNFLQPAIGMPPKLGATAFLDNSHCYILQILSPTEMLVEFETVRQGVAVLGIRSTSFTTLVYINGVPTAGLTDRQPIALKQCFHFARNKMYKTKDGSNTVPVLDALEFTSAKKQVANALKAAASGTTEKQSTDPAADETQAAKSLDVAKGLLQQGRNASAKRRLATIIQRYPNTKAAKQAKTLLTD